MNGETSPEEHDDGAPGPGPRTSLQLLRDPAFGPFFVAKTFSVSGVWIHNIVAAILAYEVSGSAFIVGLVSVAQFMPQLVLAPLAGALADRGNRLRQLAFGKFLSGVASTILAVWVAIAGVEGLPGAWPIIAVGLVTGVGFVLFAPAQNALIPALVRPNELAGAIALNSMPPTFARSIGPAIGAVVAVTFGPAAAFGLAALAAFLFVAVVLRLKVRTHAVRDRTSDTRVRTGLAYVNTDRGIIRLLIGISALAIAADPAITLTPAVSQLLVGTTALVGMFASSFGVGSGVAFVFLGALRQRIGLANVAMSGLSSMIVGLLLSGLGTTVSVVVAGFVVIGIGMTLALTALSTLLQVRLPDTFRGRVMALWSVAFLGSRPIAAAMNGWVADATVPAVAFVVDAVLVAVGMWFCRPAALARHPVPDAAQRH